MIPLTVGVVALGIAAGATGADRPTLSRALKMAASSLVVIAAIVVVARLGEVTAYAVLVVVALTLSWIGDLALSYAARRAFVVGLVAFALAHVAYIAAFATLGATNGVMVAVGAIGMSVVGIITLRWLAPHRPDELAWPITAYVVIIGVMVAAAFGTIGTDAPAVIPVAATLFAASDILVARNQFVAPGVINRVVGLPMYFLAQALFVASLL